MAVAARQVNLSLYRAMWRWTMTEPMRSARFPVPFEQLPLSVLTTVSPAKGESLHGAEGCQELIRSAWRSGAALTDPTEIQQHVDGAFSALRMMGEFQEELSKLVERRVANADRTGLRFQIGQVLRHKMFGFRAVVIGWDRRPQMDVSSWDGVQGLPSGPEQPFYRMVPDLSDCVELLGGPRDVRYVAQENLEELPLTHRRINHPGLSVLGPFDATEGRFLPTEELSFEYPGSLVAHTPSSPGSAAPEAARELLRMVVEVSSKLGDFVEAVAAQPGQEEARQAAALLERPKQRLGPGWYVLGDLLKLTRRARRVSARAMASLDAAEAEEVAEAAEARAEAAERAEAAAEGGGKGDDAEAEAEAEAEAAAADPMRGCIGSMRQLARVADFVTSNLAERRAKQNRSEIRFHVGQVLKHRKYGYRAAVFGWERRPQVDVSSWDGVQGLPSGPEQPFYRMVPDLSDCVELLGGPRGVRYVAQENLEELPTKEEARIEHELLTHVFESFDEERAAYRPVEQLRMWYPADDTPPPLHAEARQRGLDGVVHAMGSVHALLKAHVLDARRAQLLEPALRLLGAAPCAADAGVVERAASALLSVHASDALTEHTRSAEQYVEKGELDEALKSLDAALALDAAHADTWARRATVHARAGRHALALDDAVQALELEPCHFGALAVRGSALRGLRRYDEALESFEEALQVHPWADGVATEAHKARRSWDLARSGEPAKA